MSASLKGIKAAHDMLVAKAVAAEREACAKLADDYDGRGTDGRANAELGDATITAIDIAAAIRARTS